MVNTLQTSAAESGIDNITPVFGEWQDVFVNPADFVLCAHVVYTEANITGFIQRLDAHASKAVLMPTFEPGPQAHLAPLWRAVYGEERVGLPGLAELVAVLTEMGLDPSVEPAESLRPRSFTTRDAAFEHVRPRMFVRPGTGRDRALRSAVDELLELDGDHYKFTHSETQRVSLVSWQTS